MRALIISTVILLVIFAIFIIAGLFIAPSINSPSYDPQFLLSETNFFSVISMFSLMFIFFTSITSNLAYLNADLKNPSKNILKVNILPILLAVVLGDILGLPGLILMGIAAAISTLIAMNAALSSALSIMHALARDNYVSKKLLKTSKKTKVPTLILIITTSIAIIFTFLSIIFANIGFSANITTFIYFIGLAFINYAAVNLRRKRKELDRPFKAPFFPYLPIIVMSFCIILALFLEWRAIVLGVIIFSIGITYYLLTIADRHSIILTIAGLKFFAVILVGGFIWIINNLSILSSPITGFTSIFSDILLRILIFVCIFTLATIFFDIIPLKELIYFFIKKVNKKEVAIDIGIGQIIELKKSKAKIIYYANIIIGIVQIFSSLFIFTLISLFALDIISIDNITFGSTITPQVTGEYLILGFLIFLGTILLFSGPYSLYLNKETKTLGI
jgi:hypothetical protein